MKINQHLVKVSLGFTIIELLVTFVIIGILASIAIPTFSTWLPRYRLKTAARDIYSDMQLAKLEAIKRAKTCTVTMDTTNEKYTIATSSGAEIKTVSLAAFGEFATFQSSLGSTAAVIKFNSHGMASTSGKVYISNKNETNGVQYCIEVTSAGGILLNKWNGTAWE